MRSLFDVLGMSDQTPLVAVLFDAALKGAILLAATMLCSLLLRRAAAATRHLIWSLALIGMLALPFLSFIIPQWNVPVVPQILPSSESLQRLPAPEFRLPKSKPQKIYQVESREDKTWTVSTNYATSAPTPQPDSKWNNVLPAWSWGTWIFAVWLVGMLAVATRWLLGWVSVKLLSRRAEEIFDDAWYELSESLSAELNLKKPVKLLRAENAMAPMTWGLLKPVILLPPDADTWSTERRRVVLLHELAHVKRGDLLSQFLAQIACALYWFNPLAWIAARQLRVEREQACDDAVLNSGAKASDYANHILEILRALRFAKYSPSAAVAMAQCSQIESRLRAILNPNLRRRALTPTGELFLGAVVACIVLPLAAISPWINFEKTPAKPFEQMALTNEKFQYGDPKFSFGLSSGNAVNDPMVISPWPTDHEMVAGTASSSAEDCDENKNDSGVGLRLERLVQDGANRVGENLVSALHALGLETLPGEHFVGKTAEKLGNVLAAKLRDSGYDEWKINDIVSRISGGVDDEYVQDVKKAGYAQLSIEQLLQMRIHGIDAEYIKAMKAAGFDHLDIDELIQMRIHGVDADYAREMKAAYGDLSLEELLQLRIQGVDADYAKEMKAAGFGDLGVNELLQMRIHGVDADYAKAMQAAGFDELSTEELLQMRIQGVDTEYAKEMKAAYGELSLNELLQLRIQGVDTDYAKEMKAAGYDDLSIDQLLQTRIHGVDADYANEMKAAFGNLSINELLQLRIQGVDADYAREMKAAGFGELSIDELLQLRIQGVDADYTKEMKAAGFGDLDVNELLQLRIQGVDADYVKEMKAAGFDELTSDELLQMRIQGVDADFVKELKAAGLKNLTPKKAIQMRIHGFDASFFKE